MAGRRLCGEFLPGLVERVGGDAEAFLTGVSRRFSASNDLKYDAERDLRDIEAPGIAVHALSKVGRA